MIEKEKPAQGFENITEHTFLSQTFFNDRLRRQYRQVWKKELRHRIELSRDTRIPQAQTYFERLQIQRFSEGTNVAGFFNYDGTSAVDRSLYTQAILWVGIEMHSMKYTKGIDISSYFTPKILEIMRGLNALRISDDVKAQEQANTAQSAFVMDLLDMGRRFECKQYTPTTSIQSFIENELDVTGI